MNLEKIACELIKYRTISGCNLDEINNCCKFIKEYFKDSNKIIKEFIFENDKSLYISNTEDKNIDVLFIGHIDVVYASDEYFKPYVKNGKLYGRGSFDMKGHVAVMLKLLKENNFDCKVGLLITSDEERGGFNGTNKFINDLQYNSKIAIIPDAGNNFSIVDEEKGVLQLKISYLGKAAHSSQPWNGDNAISKIICLYNELINRYPLPISKSDYKTSINISKIEGGNSTNMVAKDCYVIFDVRHVVNDTKNSIIDFIKNYNKKFKIEVLATGAPFLTYKEDRYYKLFEETYKKILKKKINYVKCESASDGRFFYSKNVPCILMNAKGNDMHGPNEYINISSLYDLYKLYSEFLKSDL